MISRNSSFDEIKKMVRDCLNQFYSSDSFLLERNDGKGICERAIVFRFAHYLQNKMLKSNFFVDCDFNSSFENHSDSQGRNVGEERCGKPIENKDGTLTKRFPDIIVHKRDYNSQNDFICFEIKKWNNYNRKAIRKDANNLRILTSQYGYIYGFHISIHKIKTKTKWTIFDWKGLVAENEEVFKNGTTH